jgi:TPR repeat protein
MIRPALLALLLLPAPALAAPEGTPPTLGAALAALRDDRAPEAAQMFLALARDGAPEAQFNLALLYAKGIGVPQNDREALYWGWRARLAGVPAAIALIESLQPTAPEDLRTDIATRIIADLDPRIAAGEGRAMLERSVLLLDLLPEPDLQGAYVWQALAAALGTPNAPAARDATLARIDPKDRLAAQDATLATLRDLCGTGFDAPALCATLP